MGWSGPMNSMINISPYMRYRNVLFLISLKNINSWVGFHHHFCSHLNLSFPICPAIASVHGLLLHCPFSRLIVLEYVWESAAVNFPKYIYQERVYLPWLSSSLRIQWKIYFVLKALEIVVLGYYLVVIVIIL